MNTLKLVVLAGLGSLFLLTGALLFQYIGKMPPCKMCYWQRYPHLLAVAISILYFFTRMESLKSVGFIAASMSSAIGAYHAGVEKDWWQGPQSCTSGSINGLTTDDLLEQIMTAPLVRCNDIPWQLFGISMAGWNMIISLALAFLWFKALRLRLS